MKTPQFPDKLHRPQETKAKSLSNMGSPRSPSVSATAQSRSNLSRRGRKTRTAVTAAEVAFCAYFVLTGNVKQVRGRAELIAACAYLSKSPLPDYAPSSVRASWDFAFSQLVR